jgi:hypothetical protein
MAQLNIWLTATKSHHWNIGLCPSQAYMIDSHKINNLGHWSLPTSSQHKSTLIYTHLLSVSFSNTTMSGYLFAAMSPSPTFLFSWIYPTSLSLALLFSPLASPSHPHIHRQPLISPSLWLSPSPTHTHLHKHGLIHMSDILYEEITLTPTQLLIGLWPYLFVRHVGMFEWHFLSSSSLSPLSTLYSPLSFTDLCISSLLFPSIS